MAAGSRVRPPRSKPSENVRGKPRQLRPNRPPRSSGSAAGGVSGKEQAAQSEADCRLVLYVAHENMSRKEAEAFSELLADMRRTMESPRWTGGDLQRRPRPLASDDILSAGQSSRSS